MNNLRDITARSSKMPRNCAILYTRAVLGWKDDPPDFSGLMVTSDGTRLWVNAWKRTVRGKPVIEIRQTPARYAREDK